MLSVQFDNIPSKIQSISVIPKCFLLPFSSQALPSSNHFLISVRLILYISLFKVLSKFISLSLTKFFSLWNSNVSLNDYYQPENFNLFTSKTKTQVTNGRGKAILGLKLVILGLHLLSLERHSHSYWQQLAGVQQHQYLGVKAQKDMACSVLSVVDAREPYLA